jgi:hypothetical protein
LIFFPFVLFSIKHAALVITFNLMHYLTLRVYTCVGTFNSPPNHRLGGKVMLSILLILLRWSKTRKEKENVFIAPTSFLVCFPPLSLHVSFYFYLAGYNFFKGITLKVLHLPTGCSLIMIVNTYLQNLLHFATFLFVWNCWFIVPNVPFMIFVIFLQLNQQFF